MHVDVNRVVGTQRAAKVRRRVIQMVAALVAEGLDATRLSCESRVTSPYNSTVFA